MHRWPGLSRCPAGPPPLATAVNSGDPRRRSAPGSVRLLILWLAVISPALHLEGVATALSVGQPVGFALLATFLEPAMQPLLAGAGAAAATCLALTLAHPPWGRMLILRVGIYLGLGLSLVWLVAWTGARHGFEELSWALLARSLGDLGWVALPVGGAVAAGVALIPRLPPQVRRWGLTALLATVGIGVWIIPGLMTAAMGWTLDALLPALSGGSAAVTTVAWGGAAVGAATRWGMDPPEPAAS